MQRIIQFVKKEIVLCIALFLGLVSLLICRPSGEIIAKSIDLRVLSLLFCLMYVIQGFASINLLDKLANKMLGLCKNTRQMFFVLTFLVFFLSMAVTNDVALLTFVPISLLICKKANLQNQDKSLAAKLIVLETIAANLGSCVTPMGNPQNLYLFNFYEMSNGDFFATTLKIGIPSFFICGLLAWFFTKKSFPILSTYFPAKEKPPVLKIIVFSVLLICCLLSVFRIIDYKSVLWIVLLLGLITAPRIFLKVDYSLLFTFLGFFLFTGSISSMEKISLLFSKLLETPFATYLSALVSSQIISNVPAALLLSKFTENGNALLAGVNVAGLGTLIASLASVISFKLYKNFQSENPEFVSKESGYFRIFTIWNVLLLVILGIFVYFIL